MQNKRCLNRLACYGFAFAQTINLYTSNLGYVAHYDGWLFCTHTHTNNWTTPNQYLHITNIIFNQVKALTNQTKHMSMQQPFTLPIPAITPVLPLSTSH